MAINFSNVNISLRQFHEVASGKYNAGDIKLTSETEIDKANNHVSRYMNWRYNRETIGADEAVAVKEALIKALQRNGFTNEKKINEIRERIGLDRVAGESDVALQSRMIKPLSRKEVRDIFNANAKEINECAKKVEGGFGDVLTNEQVLTQKHHKDLDDMGLFTRSRDAINAENEAKFMKNVVESDRARLGADVKALHSHYIDCIAAGRLDRVPPEFTEPIGRFVRQEMHMMIQRGSEPPATPKDALELIGADRIKRKLTELLEKQGSLNQYDLANAIRNDIQSAVKLKEFCETVNDQIKDERFTWTKDEISYGDDKFFDKYKSRIVTPAFLLELRERGPVDEEGDNIFNVRFADVLDNAENPGDIKKEISKSEYNRKLKYVLGTFVAKKLLLRVDTEELFTPEGVRNGIGKMLVGKFLDVKGGLRLTDSELNKISKKFAPIIKAKISDEDIAAARRVNKAEPFQTIQSKCKNGIMSSAILRKES